MQKCRSDLTVSTNHRTISNSVMQLSTAQQLNNNIHYRLMTPCMFCQRSNGCTWVMRGNKEAIYRTERKLRTNFKSIRTSGSNGSRRAARARFNNELISDAAYQSSSACSAVVTTQSLSYMIRRPTSRRPRYLSVRPLRTSTLPYNVYAMLHRKANSRATTNRFYNL